MPFKSQAQRRYFHWAASKGEGDITKKMVNEWEDATPKGKKLPARVKAKKAGINDDGYPSTDEVDDGVNMKDYHSDPIEKKATIEALFDELEKIAESRKRDIGFGIGAGALGAALGAGAFLLRKPHTRAYLGHLASSTLKGVSTRAREFSAALPEGAVKDAKRVAKELRDRGFDPHKMSIAVSGTGGTGKTTFSRALAEELNIKALHLDKSGANKIWKGRDLTVHPSMLADKAKGGIIYEQTHLLSQINPDKFDAIIRIHRPMKTVSDQLKARKRGAYQWDVYDYPMIHNSIKNAFDKTKGEALHVTENLSLKLKPKGGFQAEKVLKQALEEKGIKPPKTRQHQLMSLVRGNKPTAPGTYPYVKGSTGAQAVGFPILGGGGGYGLSRSFPKDEK